MRFAVRTKLRMYWSAAVCAALLAVGVAASTHAQGSDGVRDSITLSPVSQRLEIKAGESVSGKLTVVNDGTVEERVIL